MARRAVYVSHGPVKAAHPDPREPEQLGVRVDWHASVPFELGGGGAGQSPIRLPRRLSHRRRGVWTLDEDQVGRWLRSELPGPITAPLPRDAAAAPVRWGGAIGERHVSALALALRRHHGVKRALARLMPWAGHPGMTLAIWWEFCFPGRGLGLPARVNKPLQPNPWLSPLHSLRFSAWRGGVDVSTELELSSCLAIHHPPLRLGHVTRPHVRFIEVWIDGDHSKRRTFTLDETPPLELLIRTLAPIRITGAGVDIDLDPHQLTLLRCNAESWAVLDQPETVSSGGSGVHP